MSHWYFQKDGDEVGPVSANQLVELAGRGALSLSTLVRREDMPDSIPAEKVKELKAAILATVSLNHQQIAVEQGAPADGGEANQTEVSSEKSPATDTEGHTVLTITENLANHVTNLAGVEKLEGFDLKGLFSEVFRRHTSEEVGDYFTVGGTNTTPDISQVDTTWPRPWVFFRTFILALLVSYGFYWMWESYGNVLVLPGLLITGSFAVPIAALIFFFEVNARRNVSLYQVVKMIFAGGVISMMVSLLLFSITDSLPTAWLWNLPISLPFHALRLGLGAIAWTIIFALVQDGLKQLRDEKVAALEKGGGVVGKP